MKKSEIVKQLQDEIKEHGDQHVMMFKITDLQGTSTHTMLSPFRKDKKSGNKALMNHNEFVEYCDANPFYEVK